MGRARSNYRRGCRGELLGAPDEHVGAPVPSMKLLSKNGLVWRSRSRRDQYKMSVCSYDSGAHCEIACLPPLARRSEARIFAEVCVALKSWCLRQPGACVHASRARGGRSDRARTLISLAHPVVARWDACWTPDSDLRLFRICSCPLFPFSFVQDRQPWKADRITPAGSRASTRCCESHLYHPGVRVSGSFPDAAPVPRPFRPLQTLFARGCPFFTNRPPVREVLRPRRRLTPAHLPPARLLFTSVAAARFPFDWNYAAI